MSEDWGPWTDNDLAGCPVSDGTVVEMDCFDPSELGRFRVVRKIGADDYPREYWNEVDRASALLQNFYGTKVGILRYRVLKQRSSSEAVERLRRIAENPRPLEEVPA